MTPFSRLNVQFEINFPWQFICSKIFFFKVDWLKNHLTKDQSSETMVERVTTVNYI